MLRKISIGILSTLVLLTATMLILSIWEIIDITNLLGRSFKTVLVILGAAGVLSIIFSILNTGSMRMHANTPPQN